MGKGQDIVQDGVVFVDLCIAVLCLYIVLTLGNSKPCGIRAARKLRVVRRQERWADKVIPNYLSLIVQKYKKGHNVSSIKANVLGGATMAKGIVLEKVYVFTILN